MATTAVSGMTFMEGSEKTGKLFQTCAVSSLPPPPAVSSNTLQTPVIQPILLITLFPWRCGHPLGQVRFPLHCEGCRHSQRPTGVSQSSCFPPHGNVCLLTAETRRSGATANQQFRQSGDGKNSGNERTFHSDLRDRPGRTDGSRWIMLSQLLGGSATQPPRPFNTKTCCNRTPASYMLTLA